MPTLPAPIAVRAARWLGHRATIASVVPLSPSLRRITFFGERLRGKPWIPGQEVEFYVGEGAFRHYTPAVFDREEGSSRSSSTPGREDRAAGGRWG